MKRKTFKLSGISGHNGISIIIPFNKKIAFFQYIKRISKILKQKKIKHEFLIIIENQDKFSIQKELPIKLIEEKNKTFSRYLSGINLSKYSMLALVDDELKYPPEILKEMVKKVSPLTDAVIISPKKIKKNLKFNFERFDVVLIKKERAQKIDQAYFESGQVLTSFIKNSAEFKVEFVETFLNSEKKQFSKLFYFFILSLKSKLTASGVTPFKNEIIKIKGEGFFYKGIEFISHTNLPLDENAFFNFSPQEKLLFFSLLILIFLGFLENWKYSLIVLIGVLTILYFSDLVFSLFLIIRAFVKNPEIRISDEEINKIDESKLPIYTIFCPLYKEWSVLSQFTKSIEKLDYPKEKLQVMLLLEENDKKTIEEANKLNLPSYFRILIVPDGVPKTKPKALNYGLKYAKGELAVIYDAEDIPQRDQLKKAFLAFKKIDKKIVCIQAKLNYYNPYQNLLTRLFAAEYSLWFDLILPGLQSIDAPIPLGGTSNHFRMNELKKLKGWDAFNVTEDCDLGIRLAKKGYKTAIMDSTTFEEANSRILNWYRQRSRWIKGYIQTYLVHMRKPHEFNLGKNINLIFFQLVVGGKVLSIFINPFMWLMTISYFLFKVTVGPIIESFYPPIVMYAGVVCLVFGNFLYLYSYMIGCAKRKYFELIKYVFLIPFYWFGMSLAGWKSLYEMITKPHFWAKTVHGFHLVKNQKEIISSLATNQKIDGEKVPIEALSG